MDNNKLKELENQADNAIKSVVMTIQEVYTGEVRNQDQENLVGMSIPQDYTGQMPVSFDYKKKS